MTELNKKFKFYNFKTIKIKNETKNLIYLKAGE